MGNAHGKMTRGLLALGVALALLASACGGSGSGGSSDDAGSPSSGPAADGTVNRDGTVKVGFDLTGNGQFNWEPGANSAHPSMDPLWYLAYGRLMRKADDGTFVPDQAEKVTVVDPTTIEIVVRPGQTWQDGAAFDAESVKVGLDHNLASVPTDSGFTDAFYAVKSVEVVDPMTVRLGLPGGTAASWYDTFIAAPAVTITRPSSGYDKPIGAGPMEITSYAFGQNLTMKRFEGYWDSANVNFAEMDFVHILNGQAQSSTAALQSGQADIATFDTTQLVSMTGDLKPASLSDPSRLMRIGFCKRDAPLDNEKIRQAITKAIDRDAINEVVYEGTATPAVQLWPEGNRFYSPEVGDEMGYDPEAAKQLVSESGVANPTFDLYVLNNLGGPDTAQVIEQQLKEVGITANIKIAADITNEFLGPQAPGAFIFPATQNADTLKLKDFNGTSLSNLCRWQDPEIQALFEQLSTISSTTDEAQQAWWEIDQIYADTVPGVPLEFASVVGGYDSAKLVLDGIYPGGLNLVPDIFTSYMEG